jgi:hypothetical protein
MVFIQSTRRIRLFRSFFPSALAFVTERFVLLQLLQDRAHQGGLGTLIALEEPSVEGEHDHPGVFFIRRVEVSSDDLNQR